MTRHGRPLITCGVTAYNAEDTVARAIESALAQHWENLEVVVVDDASWDGTQRVIEGIAKENPAVRVLRNERNVGVAAARNRILGEACGEFVAFFDDDDESAPDRLARQYSRIVEYEEEFAVGAPVVCHTARTLVYRGGVTRYERTMGTAPGRPAPSGWALVDRILRGTPLANGYGSCATCSQMARLAVYRAAGGFDERFRRAEDTDLDVRLAKMGCHFVGVAEPLVRQTMTAAAEKGLETEKASMLGVLEKHRDVLWRPGEYEFTRAWIGAKYDLAGGHFGPATRRLVEFLVWHPLWTMRRGILAVRNLAGSRRAGRVRAEAMTDALP